MNRSHAALFVLAALAAIFGGAGCASPDPDNPVQLGKFVADVQALEAKDFYLNVETAHRSEFPARSFSLGDDLLPHTKSQLTKLHRRWRVPHDVDGNIVVIQDPGLSALGAQNPLDLTISGIGPSTVGLNSIAGLFGITVVGPGRMIQDTRTLPSEHVTLEHAGPISLRQALNHLTREYHMEWGVMVIPSDGLPLNHPPHVTMPDGTKALRAFAKGGVAIVAEEEPNWRETVPAKSTGERGR